jgi:hypothetical protein
MEVGMKLYYTDSFESRWLQDISLTELERYDVESKDVTEYYVILNKPADTKEREILFGESERITKALRDIFWLAVTEALKHGSPIFDVDEWYGTLPEKLRKG